ncbi:MAG TPA: tetratricopeptide repeat protein [Pyrinomonadaceae bacterium]
MAIVLGAIGLTAICTADVVCQDDEVGPSDAAIQLFNKGQDAHEKGDLIGAIASYEKALKMLPEFPEAELQRGSAYQALGKLDEAVAAFRRAVELREDWSLALANLGAALVRKSAFAEAEKHLAAAIELDEQNFPAYAAMTELRLKTKADPKVLRALLSKVIALTAKANPTASIWASRASLEIAVGDVKSAKSSVARALDLDPRSQSALSTSANISLMESDPDAADGSVKRLESIAPHSEVTKALRARILAAKGSTREALEVLNAVQDPGPEITDLKNQLTAATAVIPADLEKQLGSDPTNAIALSKLCTAYRTSDPAKAMEYCRRASEAAPNDVQPVIGYGAALVQAKRYEEAVVIFRKLLAMVPNNSTARANLATALFQLKRYPEAKIEFRWLTDNQPDQAIAYYFLGIVHDQLLELADAAANYQQFLRLADPESSKLEIEKVNLRLPVIYNLLKEGKGKKRG